MTVAGIIEQYNTERPNNIEDPLKVEWLKKLEQLIIDTLIKNHQGAPEDEVLVDHIVEFGLKTNLIVEEPYDDLYIYYLDQRIATNNNDMKRYNSASTLYNNTLKAYKDKYNREHKSIQPRSYLLNHEVL